MHEERDTPTCTPPEDQSLTHIQHLFQSIYKIYCLMHDEGLCQRFNIKFQLLERSLQNAYYSSNLRAIVLQILHVSSKVNEYIHSERKFAMETKKSVIGKIGYLSEYLSQGLFYVRQMWQDQSEEQLTQQISADLIYIELQSLHHAINWRITEITYEYARLIKYETNGTWQQEMEMFTKMVSDKNQFEMHLKSSQRLQLSMKDFYWLVDYAKIKLRQFQEDFTLEDLLYLLGVDSDEQIQEQIEDLPEKQREQREELQYLTEKIRLKVRISSNFKELISTLSIFI